MTEKVMGIIIAGLLSALLAVVSMQFSSVSNSSTTLVKEVGAMREEISRIRQEMVLGRAERGFFNSRLESAERAIVRNFEDIRAPK